MGQLSTTGDRQRNSPEVKHSLQRSFLMGEMPNPQMVPDDLIRRCKNRLDAIRLCVQLASCSHEVIAESLGIDKGHWTRMMQGKAYFPDHKSISLMERCGNYAPMQFEAMACGFRLVEERELEIQTLRAKLAELESVHAA